MRLDEYQIRASKTAKYKQVGNNPSHPTLGLMGEIGKLADKVRKVEEGIRDIGAIKLCLAYALWYLAQIATEFNLSLEAIAECSLEKAVAKYGEGK